MKSVLLLTTILVISSEAHYPLPVPVKPSVTYGVPEVIQSPPLPAEVPAEPFQVKDEYSVPSVEVAKPIEYAYGYILPHLGAAVPSSGIPLPEKPLVHSLSSGLYAPPVLSPTHYLVPQEDAKPIEFSYSYALPHGYHSLVYGSALPINKLSEEIKVPAENQQLVLLSHSSGSNVEHQVNEIVPQSPVVTSYEYQIPHIPHVTHIVPQVPQVPEVPQVIVPHAVYGPPHSK